MFTVPDKVKKTAADALALYTSTGQSASAVATATAKRLASGGKVDEMFIRKLSRYFPKGSRAADPLLASLWGGTEGKLWADTAIPANFSIEVVESVRVAEFALADGRIVGHNKVYDNCLVFQAGEFKDKNITVTPEDLAQRVANSEPVFLNLEHFNTDPRDSAIGAFAALDGNLGEVTRFWMDPMDPTIARGEVTIPLWLDDSLDKRGLSMEIPFTEGAGFSGGAITYTPRISQAAMMSDMVARFKKAKKEYTAGGVDKIQQIHDMCERGGAICKGSDKAAMSTAHEAGVFQATHDQMCEAGAQCRILSPQEVTSAQTAGPYYYSNKEKSKMPLSIKNFKALVASWRKVGQPEDLDIDTEGIDASGVHFSMEPAIETVDFSATDQYKMMQAKIDASENERIVTFAAANVAAIEKLLTEDKMVPADREFNLGWRNKDAESFDRHFMSIKPLGNTSAGGENTIDADEVARQRGAKEDVDLANPYSEAQFKAEVEVQRQKSSSYRM